MSSGVSLTVGDDLVRPVIEAKSQAAIVEALGGQGAVIESLVTQVLGHRVKKREYSSETWSILEKVCHETLTHAIEGAVREWAKTHHEQIKAEVSRQLTSKKGTSALVRQMLEGVASISASAYRLTVTLPNS